MGRKLPLPTVMENLLHTCNPRRSRSSSLQPPRPPRLTGWGDSGTTTARGPAVCQACTPGVSSIGDSAPSLGAFCRVSKTTGRVPPTKRPQWDPRECREGASGACGLHSVPRVQNTAHREAPRAVARNSAPYEAIASPARKQETRRRRAERWCAVPRREAQDRRSLSFYS